MRILILSASTGGGHMSAADAIKSYILKYNQEAVVKIVDTLEYISPLLNKTVSGGYVHIVTKAPKMFGIMYKSANKDGEFLSATTTITNLFSKKLLPLLENFKPDAIVSTHHFATNMISKLKNAKIVKTPLICVMTDYAPHRAWISEHVDAYIVAHEDMLPTMKYMGVQEEKIYPFGIPVNKSFYIKQDGKSVLGEIGLSEEILTILIMAGSFGVKDILEIYCNITKIDLDFQLIIITGKNKKLYEAFEKEIFEGDEISKSTKFSDKIKYYKKRVHKKQTKLIFFTEEVHKYMQISDLIITKPGGLTISEALACDLPMAIFSAYPGQEEENADFLLKNNMAIRLEKGPNCENSIRNLLFDRKKLKAMKTSCASFDKSSSGEQIFSLLERLINNRNIKNKKEQLIL
ncbi:MAG: galactosyldiacylglycerol synthase [Oscillospiraceae bacterium]|jgi:processive 1,2-diacylglycerol beta-glucosyltransferase|nr:galactosyldiacylglycerol synthase [Oscillospiraceae bacterium]